jgi:hypothetical protein
MTETVEQSIRSHVSQFKNKDDVVAVLRKLIAEKLGQDHLQNILNQLKADPNSTNLVKFLETATCTKYVADDGSITITIRISDDLWFIQHLSNNVDDWDRSSGDSHTVTIAGVSYHNTKTKYYYDVVFIDKLVDYLADYKFSRPDAQNLLYVTGCSVGN